MEQPRRDQKQTEHGGILLPVLCAMLAFVGCFTAFFCALGVWFATSGAGAAAPLPNQPLSAQDVLARPAEGSPAPSSDAPSAPESPPAAQAVPTPAPAASAPSAPEIEQPAADWGDEGWLLRLVNPWNAMPEGYEPPLAQYSEGVWVDERCLADLQAMMNACRAAGLSPVICSAYRTWQIQERLYQNKINQLCAQGLSAEDAAAQAGKIVAVPGTSEHQLGLALDIVDQSNQSLDRSQADTGVQKWLMEHSWEYGFILRYPSDKTQTTGIIYEPWHYRYVGRETAEEITRLGVCLEEYLAAG